MTLQLAGYDAPVPTERLAPVTALWRRFRPDGLRARALDRDRAIDDAQRVADIKWQWRKACEVSGLGRLVYTPSGPSMSMPVIGRVELGPPTTITVRLQPGQLPDDIRAVAPRIAAAMSVARIDVRSLAAEWVAIELLPGHARPATVDPTRVLPFPGPASSGPMAA
jgi:hypothetical protein